MNYNQRIPIGTQSIFVQGRKIDQQNKDLIFVDSNLPDESKPGFIRRHGMLFSILSGALIAISLAAGGYFFLLPIITISIPFAVLLAGLGIISIGIGAITGVILKKFVFEHPSVRALKDMYLRVKNINLQDKRGNTQLHTAVQNNDLAEILSLIDQGANPNVQDKDGNTPLHLAVKEGQSPYLQAKMIHFLNINKFADFGIQDNNGKTATDLINSSPDAYWIKVALNMKDRKSDITQTLEMLKKERTRLKDKPNKNPNDIIILLLVEDEIRKLKEDEIQKLKEDEIQKLKEDEIQKLKEDEIQKLKEDEIRKLKEDEIRKLKEDEIQKLENLHPQHGSNVYNNTYASQPENHNAVGEADRENANDGNNHYQQQVNESSQGRLWEGM